LHIFSIFLLYINVAFLLLLLLMIAENY